MESGYLELPEEQKQQIRCAVLSVVKSAMFGAEPDIPNELDRMLLFSALDEQTILLLTYDRLDSLSLNEQEYDLWKKSLGQLLAKNIRVQYTENRVLRLLRDNLVDAAVLKGSAAACYYPVPDYRTRGDIDLLVPPAQFDRAAAVLEENGFPVDDRYSYFKHRNYLVDSVVIELHRYFINADGEDELSSVPTPIEPNNALLYDAVPLAEMRRVGGFESSILPDMENGLVLLLHMKQHVKTGLGLRQIIDWMMFADRCLDDEAWEKRFRVLAQRTGTETLAKVVTRMCQLKMGLRENGITWCVCDETVCESLMEYLFANGNFGKNASFLEKKTHRLELLRSPVSAIRFLQRRGEQNWKLLEKRPYLRCFAWLYQGFRFAGLLFTNRLNAGKTRQVITELEKKSRLISQLGL